MLCIRVWLVLVTVILTSCGGQADPEMIVESEVVKRANILLIVADDMGYTDLGVYGSEIDTPNLDQLASSGLILTDFHNQATCASTRASLLSGTDHHNAGGAQALADNQRGKSGYENYLNEDVVSFVTLLRDAEYNTSFTGKWHMGGESHKTPDARGFERSFALIEGGASHYSDARGLNPNRKFVHYVENGIPVKQLPKDFYSSNTYTDYIINYIDADTGDDKPFFAFLSFTAPHWPLQAPDEYVSKYKGAYDDGYEVLREQRIVKAKKLGVIPADAIPYPRLQQVPPWESLTGEEKKFSTRKMEIYAGMVDALDKNVGRLITHLKDIGEYENTFIVFLSDNGAEGADRDPGAQAPGWSFDNSFDNMGKINSHIHTGASWAQASGGVARYYKMYSSEGGNRGPAFVHYPKMTKQGKISHAFSSVIDLAPTFLELAKTTHPERGYNGRLLEPIQGISMVPLVLGDAESIRPDDFTFGWEIAGHRAVRQGDWKLLWLSSSSTYGVEPKETADHWGLYNLANDPGEVNDLSASEPERVETLLQLWEEYVAENGIILPNYAGNE